MAAVAAGIVLFYPLLSPPLGSSGLSWAMLPAGVLAAALWLCRSNTSARLATYAVVASLLAVVLCGIELSQTDWLFGHTQGPPQLAVATFVSSTIAVLTGGVWIMSKFAARQQAVTSDSVAGGRELPPIRWTGAAAVVPLTLLSCLLAVGSILSLPQAMMRIDNYIRRRQINAQIFHPHATPEPAFTPQRQQEITAIVAGRTKQLDDNDPAERRPTAKNLRAAIRNIREHSPQAQIIDTPATQAALIARLDGDDPVVCAYAAMAILEFKGQAERPDRLKAIDVLGARQEPVEATEVMVMLLRTLECDPGDEECRCAAIRSLGRMGRDADAAYRQIEVISLKGTAAERAAATEALSHIGPAAGQPRPGNVAPAPP